MEACERHLLRSISRRADGQLGNANDVIIMAPVEAGNASASLEFCHRKLSSVFLNLEHPSTI